MKPEELDKNDAKKAEVKRRPRARRPTLQASANVSEVEDFEENLALPALSVEAPKVNPVDKSSDPEEERGGPEENAQKKILGGPPAAKPEKQQNPEDNDAEEKDDTVVIHTGNARNMTEAMINGVGHAVGATIGLAARGTLRGAGEFIAARATAAEHTERVRQRRVRPVNAT